MYGCFTMNAVELNGNEHVDFLIFLLSDINLHIALIHSNDAVLLGKLPRNLDIGLRF